MRILDLYITKICNLNCEYCYVDLVSSEKQFDQKTITKRIELLKYDHIKFFGGEPLLKYWDIKKIVELIGAKNKKTKFSIVTNGFLLNDEKLQFCDKYNIEIIISVHKKWFKTLFPNFWKFLQSREIVGFSFIFEPESISFPRKVIEKLIRIGFINFTLTPEIYSDWNPKNIVKLEEELNMLLGMTSWFPDVKLKGIDGNNLKQPVVWCEKTIMNTDGKISLCNRFKKLDILHTYNYQDIHNIFDEAIGYSKDKYKWFYVCPIGWFLDQIEDTENFYVKILQYKSLNRTFINFHKRVASQRWKTNFLTDGIEEVRLNLTSQCNIRCEYCYIDFKNEVLDYEIWKNIINFYMSQDGQKKILSFFGGEPLLEFSTLKKLVIYAEDLAKDLNKEIHFIIATNFLLMNQDIACFLREYKFELHVSCNWKPDVNDYMRDGSSSRLFAHIEKYQKIIPLESISLLLAFSQKEVGRLYENIEFFHMLGFKTINLELIANHKEYKWNKRDVIILKRELLKVKVKHMPLNFLNLEREKKFIDISVHGKAWENSFDFHEYTYDFKMKQVFDFFVSSILKK